MIDPQKIFKIMQSLDNPSALIEALLPLEVKVQSLAEVFEAFEKIRVYKAKDGSTIIKLFPKKEEETKTE